MWIVLPASVGSYGRCAFGQVEVLAMLDGSASVKVSTCRLRLNMVKLNQQAISKGSYEFTIIDLSHFPYTKPWWIHFSCSSKKMGICPPTSSSENKVHPSENVFRQIQGLRGLAHATLLHHVLLTMALDALNASLPTWLDLGWSRLGKWPKGERIATGLHHSCHSFTHSSLFMMSGWP